MVVSFSVPVSSCFHTLLTLKGTVGLFQLFLRFWHALTPCCFCLSLGRHGFCDSLLYVQILHHIDCACHKGDSHLISRLVDSDVSFSRTGSLLHATFLCVLLVGRYPKCSASLEGSYSSFELRKSMKCHTSQGDTSQ
jgi:hypothetical protein